MEIKELRLSKGLTQEKASKIVGLSLRTYQNYESGSSFRDTFKINNIIRILNEYEPYTKETGIYSIDKIIAITNPIFEKYGISYAYLFGSYAKGIANEKSDIDLMVSAQAKGLQFVGLQDDLIHALNKDVDLIRIDSIKDSDFLNEVLLTGVKIYVCKE